MKRRLTHTDERGTARMVDVSAKRITARKAVASASVQVSREILELIRGNQIAKGDVLTVARIAGIQAAKKTADLVPLCHPIPVSSVAVDLSLQDEPPAVKIVSEVKTVAPTGVEMEALCAVTVAALVVYDMCKGVDRSMVIGPVQLEAKSGGRSGPYRR